MGIAKEVFLKYQALGFNLIPLGRDRFPVVTYKMPDGKPIRFFWK